MPSSGPGLSRSKRAFSVDDARVSDITTNKVVTTTGRRFRHDACIWAAGMRAPSTARQGGLEVDAGAQNVPKRRSERRIVRCASDRWSHRKMWNDYCERSEVHPLYSATLSRVTSFDGKSSTVDAGF